jgi:hypothetical protein
MSIPKHLKKIYNRTGGLPPVHITDDSGKVLYSDKDMMRLAKWSADRGGAAANANMFEISKEVDIWLDKTFNEDWECPNCKIVKRKNIETIYYGWKAPYGENVVRCYYCWKDYPPTPIPEDKKEYIEKIVGLSREYEKINLNDRRGQQEWVLKQMELSKGEDNNGKG